MAPPPRRTESTPKRERIQRDVLRAMEELLAEGETYAELGVERIAGRAGISRTSFYFYFRDKREVLERLTATVADELYGAAELWWSGTGISHEALRTSIRDVSALFVEHGPLLRAMVEVGTYERDVADHWRTLIGRFVDATEDRIVTEQAAGNAPAFPARPTAFALVWSVERSLYQQLVRDEDFDTTTLVDAISSMWLRAIYGRLDPGVTAEP
ncbi:TetR/AcrR family transcriptional regulator [Patulibacter minatonensis]|uniref:TetR/AcrR family transcriptional regulator n=1 Tax=Patulibacter minatonensis TaxID=298163 RepID=UPI00047E4454|nr:TetR/AcrR family transcriptional regulator [Patulibacter minatonensis]